MKNRRSFPSQALRTAAHPLFSGLFELLFPQICKICGCASKEPLCAGCLQAFSRITGAVCERCGKPCVRAVTRCRECSPKRLHFSRARSAGVYTGTLKEAIHSLKYRNGRRIAPYLGRFLDEEAVDLMDDIDSIAFVPLDRVKEAKRGYNQSRLLAEDLSRRYHKPLFTGLIKIRKVPEQHNLGFAERGRNVKGAFRTVAGAAGQVLLIDDVYTTGSTASECAKALKKAGAGGVYVLTIARTPLDSA